MHAWKRWVHDKGRAVGESGICYGDSDSAAFFMGKSGGGGVVGSWGNCAAVVVLCVY